MATGVQGWDEWGYLACGIMTAAPLVLYPLLRPGAADRGKPLAERFWVKANVWHAVFGFVGNYFWTHYFFQLLGASYTMPSHRLNQARLGARARGQAVQIHGTPLPCAALQVPIAPACRSRW